MGSRRDSHSGGAVALHDEQAAEKLLKSGLKAVGLTAEDLECLKKNDDRKKVVAWLIRKNTSVKNEWVSNVLRMGNMATVSRSVREVEEAVDGALFELKIKISKIKD